MLLLTLLLTLMDSEWLLVVANLARKTKQSQKNYSDHSLKLSEAWLNKPCPPILTPRERPAIVRRALRRAQGWRHGASGRKAGRAGKRGVPRYVDPGSRKGRRERGREGGSRRSAKTIRDGKNKNQNKTNLANRTNTKWSARIGC